MTGIGVGVYPCNVDTGKVSMLIGIGDFDWSGASGMRISINFTSDIGQSSNITRITNNYLYLSTRTCPTATHPHLNRVTGQCTPSPFSTSTSLLSSCTVSFSDMTHYILNPITSAIVNGTEMGQPIRFVEISKRKDVIAVAGRDYVGVYRIGSDNLYRRIQGISITDGSTITGLTLTDRIQPSDPTALYYQKLLISLTRGFDIYRLHPQN